ncbi:MAG: amino acid synthesis family protein [Chloroflexota bacterium]
MDIQKTVTVIEDILIEGGRSLPRPVRRVALIVVVRNPLVGRDDENLGELVHDGEDLGRFLAKRGLEWLPARQVTSVGKGTIVGSDGEPEHGQAILYPKFAASVRETLGKDAVPIMGEKVIAAAGSAIKIPLQRVGEGGGADGAMEIRVPGSPRSNEILVALVLSGTSDTGSG